MVLQCSGRRFILKQSVLFSFNDQKAKGRQKLKSVKKIQSQDTRPFFPSMIKKAKNRQNLKASLTSQNDTLADFLQTHF